MGIQEKLAALKQAQEIANDKKRALEKAEAQKTEKEARRSELTLEREKVAAELSQAEQTAKETETALAEANEYKNAQGDDLTPEAEEIFNAMKIEEEEAIQSFEKLKSQLEEIDAELGGAEGAEPVIEPYQTEEATESVQAEYVESAVEPDQTEQTAESAPTEAVEEKAEIKAEEVAESASAEVSPIEQELTREMTAEESAKIEELKTMIASEEPNAQQKEDIKEIQKLEYDLRNFGEKEPLVGIAIKYAKEKGQFLKEGELPLDPIESDLTFRINESGGAKVKNMRYILGNYINSLEEIVYSIKKSDPGRAAALEKRMVMIGDLIKQLDSLSYRIDTSSKESRQKLGDLRGISRTINKERELAFHSALQKLKADGVDLHREAETKYMKELSKLDLGY